MTSLRVVAAHPGTTVQDLGRPGLGHLGVGRSGAADRGALRAANRLAGNPDGAAAVEVTFGGLRLEVDGPVRLALTGADAPLWISDVDGERGLAVGSATTVRAGAHLALAAPARGLRSYLAVRGGIAVEPVLGSCSRDTLARLGPEPLSAGALLPIGETHAPRPPVDQLPLPRRAPGPVTLHLLPGPDRHLLDDPQGLTGRTWEVTPRCDRIGVQWGGSSVAASTPASTPSKAMVPGAIQLPPDGAPLLLLADHPVTGGYPVVGVLGEADTDRAAQLRPGDRLRLVLAARRPGAETGLG